MREGAVEQHNWQLVEGSVTQWECATKCGAQMETKAGVHPTDVQHRGLVPPFDPCCPEREQVFSSLRQAEALARTLGNVYEGWPTHPVADK
jgi:hypothetical protein